MTDKQEKAGDEIYHCNVVDETTKQCNEFPCCSRHKFKNHDTIHNKCQQGEQTIKKIPKRKMQIKNKTYKGETY